MKRISLIIILVANALFSKATNWYISSVSGDNNRTSTQAHDKNTPWQTLAKMNSFMSSVQPGDSILLKRGERFYGTLILAKSGNSTSPIIISGYGTSSAQPIITGMDSVKTWASAGTNKYVANITNGLSYVDVVTKDSSLQEMGRWPNSNAANGGWLRFNSYNTAGTQITDDSLSTAINYVGAGMVISPERYFIIRGAITAQVTNNDGTRTLTFVNTTGYEPRTRFAYFIQGALFTLNRQNEWYYNFNASPKTLTWYSTTGAPTGVEIATVTDGITATNFSDITITGVHVSGYQGSGIKFTGGARNKVVNNTVDNCGYYGVFMTSTSGLIYNNNITDCLNTSVQCGSTGTSSTNTIVRKNYIDSTSIFSGHCQTPSNFGQGYGINASGTGMIVDSNELDHQGFIAIQYYKWNNIKILKNYIHHYNMTKDDGGSIYTLTNSTTIVNTGRKIQGNLITDGVGAPYFGSTTAARSEGIYMDLGADGNDISGNFLMDCSIGIYLNIGAKHNSVHNNLIYVGTNGREGLQANYRARDPVDSNTFRNNTIWVSDENQELIYASSDIRTLPGISSDSNRFMNLSSYSTPFEIDTPAVRHVAFSTWKSVTGYDAHSTQTTFTSTDSIRVYINSSFTPMVLDLTSGGNSYNWITPTGTVSSYTLAGRSAIILKRGAIVAAVRPTATASYSAIACNGGTSTVTVSVVSGGTAPFTYSINNGVSYQSGTQFTGQTAGAKSIIVKDANNLKDTADVTILQPTLLSALSTITDSILCYGGSTNLTIDGSGGTTPYILGTGTKTVAAGTASYSVTDSNGCTASTSRTVTQPSLLTLSESHTAIAVNGGTSTVTFTRLGGTTSWTYKLDGSAYQSSNVFASILAGSHTAYVKDFNNCETRLDFTITQPTVAVTAIATNTVAIACNGQSTGTVVVSGTGGTVPYTYSKDGASYQSSSTFSGLPAGAYTFYVKDNVAAVATSLLTLAQPTAFVATAATSDSILCNGLYTSVRISGSGGTTPYIGTDTVNTMAGYHSYTLTDGNGCTASTAINITQPTALTITDNNYGLVSTIGGTTSDTVIASGGTGTLSYSIDASTSETTYEAEDATLVGATVQTSVTGYEGTGYVGFTTTSGQSIQWTVTAATSGTHLAQIRYALGVAASRSMELRVNGSVVNAALEFLPTGAWNAWVDLSVNVTLTAGSNTIKLSSTGSRGVNADNLTINSGYQSSNIFTDLAVGGHTVTVKDANNCLTTLTFNIPLSVLSATASATSISCFGGTSNVTVSGTGGEEPYSGTGVFVETFGTHNYLVTDAQGDTAAVAVTITQPDSLMQSVAVTNITTTGGTGKAVVTGSGGTTPYTFSLNAGAYVTSGTFSGLAAGNYSVTTKDFKGCVTPPTSFTVLTTVTPSTTIITRRSGFNVYADFNTTVSGVANMRITDAANNLVKNQNVNVPVGQSTFSMSIKSLTKGAYYTFTVTMGTKTSILSFKR